MTDPDRGRWPPVSVWLAAGLLTLPPAGFVLALVAHTPAAEHVVLPGLWLLAAGVNAGRLLAGNPSGVKWAAVLLGLVGLFAAALFLGIALGGAYQDLWPAAVPVGYLAAVAALLWWPETRRWCGLLPPADREGE